MDCKRKLSNLADLWHSWKVSWLFHIFFVKKPSNLNATKYRSVYLDFNTLNSIPCLCDPVWSRSSNTDIMSIPCNCPGSNNSQYVAEGVEKPLICRAESNDSIGFNSARKTAWWLPSCHLTHEKPALYICKDVYSRKVYQTWLSALQRKKTQSCTMQMSEKTTIQNPRAPVSDHSQMSLCLLQWCHLYHCNILNSLSL